MTLAQPRRSSRRSFGERWSKRPRTSLFTELQVEPAKQSSSRLGKPGPWGTPRPHGLGSQIRFSSRSTWEEGRGRREEGQAADTVRGGRWERVGYEYLQLGAAFLQGFHRQLQGCAVAVHASADLQDLELGAAVALEW